MDIEQRFICALITAPRNEQNSLFARQVPLSIFKQREPEISWIFSFRDKHSRFPTPSAVQTRFKWKVKKVRETIAEALDIVIGQEHYREIKRAVDETRELIDQGRDMIKVVEYFKRQAQNLRTFDVSSNDIQFSTSTGARQRYAELLKEIKNPTGNLFQSPWPKLNALVKYFRPEELIMLVGRLGMGKSWLMVFWADYLAAQGSRVLLVSKEMSTATIEDRLESMRFRLDWEMFRGGKLTAQDLLRWRRARLKRKKSDIIITGSETMIGTGFEEITAKVEKYQPQVTMIDAAYRIAVTDLPKNANDAAKLTYIAQTSKRLAKTYKQLVIDSTQMNRGAEEKDGTTKGNVGQVFGSDAWMQEADAGFEVWGNRNVEDQRMLSVLKGREFKGVCDIAMNFRLSPYPDFSEMTGSALEQLKPKSKFKGL